MMPRKTFRRLAVIVAVHLLMGTIAIGAKANESCSVESRAVCVRSGPRRSGCEFYHKDTTFEFSPRKDSTNGVFDFVFTVLEGDCPYDTYKVLVKALDERDNEFKHIHMFKIDANVTQCSQIRLEFCLMYLFSGNYSFSVTPQNGVGSVDNKIELKNGHSVEDFCIKNVTFSISNYESSLKAELQILQSPILNSDDLTYKVRIDDEAFNDTEKKDLDFRDVTSNCTRNKLDIVCLLNNLRPGNHALNFDLLDEWRCKIKHDHPIYGQCNWEIPFERNPPNFSKLESLQLDPTSNWFGGIITFSVIFVACITSLVGWLFFKKKKAKKPSQQTFDNMLCTGIECHVNREESVDGIYLVYARDCPDFMKVMFNLRILLHKMTGCKIYDVFDDDLFNEIALNPNEWVQSHIQNPNIKVVLVATECADYLYQTIMKNHSNPSRVGDNRLCRIDPYRMPSYFNSVVMYSMKLISFDVTPTPYHKFFVVRFPKFNSHDDYMTHVNPFKRFDMPENLQILTENILHQTAATAVDVSDWESYATRDVFREKVFVNEEIFVQSVNELNDFFKKNPTYLMSEILSDDSADVDPFDYKWPIVAERSRHGTM